MKHAIAAILLAAPAAAQVIEDYEHGNEGLYLTVAGTADTLNVTGGAARNGAFGAEFVQGVGPSWRLNPAIQTAPGNVYRVFVRVRGGLANNGRSYLGVGATGGGAWSAVFAPNTSQIILQNNTGFGFVTAATAAATIAADTWYQMELDWSLSGDMVVSLLDEAGTSVLASTPSVATGFTSKGGVILRGFTTNVAAFHDFDTLRKRVSGVSVTDDLPGTFVDISGTGTALNLADDGEVDIPTTVGNALLAAGTARVGSNGGVRFDGAGTQLGFTNLPLPSVDVFNGGQALLPFWDDVNTVGGTVGNVYWQEIGNTLYVQWDDVGFFLDAVNRATFQLQVHASGPAYAQFLYTDVENVRAAGGGSATIGYQAGATGTNTVQYSLDAPAAVRNGTVLSVVDRKALLFTDTRPGSWIEISGTGTPLNLTDDGEVDIPTTVGNSLFLAGMARVGSNGGVRFAGTGLELGFTNAEIPSASAFSGQQTLLPFWDDVNTVGGTVGNVYWQEVGSTLVVQWDNVGFFNDAVNRATFQLQVHATGDVPAQFVYRDVTSARADRGGSATIGYQGGLVGGNAPYSFNTQSVGNGTVLSLVQANREVGASYCVANPNSTGRPGELVLSGTASVSANDLRLHAIRLPNNAFGYFIASTTTGFVPNAGGGMGNICLGGNIGRGVGGMVLNTGGNGQFTILANLSSIPQPGGPVAGLPGETWNFQAWHRDSVGGVATSNLTNAAQVQLQP